MRDGKDIGDNHRRGERRLQRNDAKLGAVRFDEVSKKACFMLLATNFGIDFADVLKRLRLACDSPTVLEHEVRRARARGNKLRWPAAFLPAYVQLCFARWCCSRTTGTGREENSGSPIQRTPLRQSKRRENRMNGNASKNKGMMTGNQRRTKREEGKQVPRDAHG